MTNNYIRNIERLVGVNRLEAAIDTLLDTLARFNSDENDARQEIAELRKYIIGLSQRLHQANDNRKSGVSTDDDVARERRNVSANLVELVNEVGRYPHFERFLQVQADEDAWQQASSQNTIEAYQAYFTHFPNGKYTDETQRLIRELREVERRRSDEMKRMAEEEKQRRAGATSAFVNTPPPGNSQQRQFTQPPPGSAYHPPRQQGFPGEAPRSAYGSQAEKVDLIYLVIGYVATLFIPLVGLAGGAYLRMAKDGSSLKYDEPTRQHGLYLLILGGVMAVINLALLSEGGF